MNLTNNILGALLRHRTRQLRFEREKRGALEEANMILAAYVAHLIDESGGARISKARIKDFIGKYSANISSDGEDYVIEINRGGFTSGGKNG